MGGGIWGQGGGRLQDGRSHICSDKYYHSLSAARLRGRGNLTGWSKLWRAAAKIQILRFLDKPTRVGFLSEQQRYCLDERLHRRYCCTQKMEMSAARAGNQEEESAQIKGIA